MLSSPDAKGSKGERFGLRRPIGGEAQHDLVSARARESINGHLGAALPVRTEPPLSAHAPKPAF